MRTPGLVHKRLNAAGSLMKLSTLVLGILWWFVTCLGVWLVLFLLDNLLRLPAGLRLPLAAAGGGLIAVGLVRRILWPFIRPRKVERTALALEAGHGVDDNLLINACQFETQHLKPEEQVFAWRTVDASKHVLDGIPRALLWRTGSLKRWAAAAALVWAAWIVYGLAFPRQSRNAFARYAMPLGDIPPVGSVTIVLTPSSDVSLCEGDDLSVAAEIRATDRAAETSAQHSPVLVWAEGERLVGHAASDGEPTPMSAHSTRKGLYVYTFRNIQRSFSFRALAGDTYSLGVRVSVTPLPKIVSSLFRVTPPAYTGLARRESPGPPAAVSGLPGSRLDIEIRTEPPVRSMDWVLGSTREDFAVAREGWAARTRLDTTGAYEIKAVAMGRAVSLAAGEVGIEVDHLPEVDFVTNNRNRFVTAGEEVDLDLTANDDFGISDITITSQLAGENGTSTNAVTVHKTWTYLGPPGRADPVSESFRLVVDPVVFVPGEAYLLHARCRDFRPKPPTAVSRPIVLRVKSWRDLQIASTDPLARAFDLLRRTVIEQKRANDRTDTLRTHLEEVLKGKHLTMHRDGMAKQQALARDTGLQAAKELLRGDANAPAIGSRLEVLVQHEMSAVLTSIAGLVDAGAGNVLPADLARIAERQEYILNELIALLGRLSRQAGRETGRSEPKEETPALRETLADDMGDLADDLEAFTRAQKRIVKRSMTLMDKAPEDLTDAEEDILGELAREEAKWADFFEEKLTDFSKLPLQDFADGSLAEEFNEIIHDVKKGAAELYAKNIELAVPLEQSGLEKAEELVHNLEKWLAEIPDNIKWNMEEPEAPPDIPLAELPAELEDMVGELLDSEESMFDDVEDVTSSWMDSLDKGAGWTAMDGPISDMSAKGVTGNLLPNQHEIGGRSGEGRTGRSHGQMVEASAEGKGGRETPTRLTPSPFESGSVEDTSREDTGGATGGGKLSGFAGEGLRGPAAPPVAEKMARLAGQQAQIRQGAEALSLKLRRYKLPSGDLEVSVQAMKRFEEAAKRVDGLGVRRAYSRAVDALAESRRAVRAQAGLYRERLRLPEAIRSEIMAGLRDGTPRGYEDMAAEYFRRVAEGTREAAVQPPTPGGK